MIVQPNLRALSIVTLLFVSLSCACGGSDKKKKDDARDDRASTSKERKGEKSAAAAAPPVGPEGLSGDKPITAKALREGYAKNKEGWTGKEVWVIGRHVTEQVTKNGNTGQVTSVTASVGEPEGWSPQVMCVTDEEPPADFKTQRENRVYKGTVARAFAAGAVVLEPCAYVR